MKLVGPTISCHEPPVPKAEGDGETVPHVQFSAIATDQVFLASDPCHCYMFKITVTLKADKVNT